MAHFAIFAKILIMKKFFVPSLMLVLLVGALHSCKSNADDFDGKVLYVPLLKDQKTELPTYDGYWTSVDTVVLESSTTECLVDRISSARFTDKHIFISTMSSALHIFDYQGNHIKKIQRSGRGRGEYDMLVHFDVQEEQQLISIADGSNIMRIYNFNGDFIRQFDLKNNINDFVVLSNGHYIFLNIDDEMNGIRGLYETDEKGNILRYFYELPDYYWHISRSYPYLIHLSQDVISCYGLEDTDLIYHFENNELTPLYKFKTDIEMPMEILKDDGRWTHPDKEYCKAGFFESDRILGFTVTNFDDFVQVMYDKQEDKLYRMYRDDLMNHPEYFQNPTSFQYSGYGRMGFHYDPEVILDIPEFKAAFPYVTLDSNPIFVIWH